jgi:hypothetical protein
MKTWKTATKKRGRPKKVGTTHTHLDRVSEAKAALDVAHGLYVDAVIAGNADNIRIARRALMIAIANYIAVVGGEQSEAEETPPE